MTDRPVTLLLTRPEPQSLALRDDLLRLLDPAPAIAICPLVEIRLRDDPIDLDGIAGVVATSANAIRALAQVADPVGLPAWCVGDSTAQAARDAGMRAQSAQGDGEDLTNLLLHDRPGGPLLVLRGADVRVDVAAALKRAGMAMRVQVVYDQVALPLRDPGLFAGPGAVLAPLYSPNTARHLAAALPPTLRADLHLVTLSPAVAGSWTGPRPASVTISPKPQADEMLDTIARTYRRLSA